MRFYIIAYYCSSPSKEAVSKDRINQPLVRPRHEATTEDLLPHKPLLLHYGKNHEIYIF